MKSELRIVFMGTPDFAVGVLKALVASPYQIVGVVTAPDKPRGRGRKVIPSAVKSYAEGQQLRILQPTNLKEDTFINELRSLKANLQVVVAFRMLPKVVWQMPTFGTFNLHASLLPKYRGAAPINWAIIHQEVYTGVTAFYIDEKIDTGAIIDAMELPIAKDETAGSLHDKLMEVGCILVVKTIHDIANQKTTTRSQPIGKEYKALSLNEAPKLHAANTYIPWQKSYADIDAFVRGLNPYPSAWTFALLGDEKVKLKIFKVAIVADDDLNEFKNISPEKGSIFIKKKRMLVYTGSIYIEILELQMSGKRIMTTKELLNGFKFPRPSKMIVNPHYD